MSFRSFIYNLYCTLLCVYLVGVTLESEALGQSQVSQTEAATTYFNNGIAKADLGNYEGAIADFDEAIEINPQHARAYYNRGTIKAHLDNYEGAIADYNEAIAINPQHTDAYFYREIAKIQLGQ